MAFRVLTFVSIAGGCGFQPATATDGGPISDVGSASYIDGHVTDGGTCFGTKDIICLAVEPSGTLTLPTTTPMSTDSDCTEVILGQCVIAAYDIDVIGSLIAIGSRPLVLVAANAITISGSVDVSARSYRRGSARARTTRAALPRIPVLVIAAVEAGELAAVSQRPEPVVVSAT